MDSIFGETGVKSIQGGYGRYESFADKAKAEFAARPGLGSKAAEGGRSPRRFAYSRPVHGQTLIFVKGERRLFQQVGSCGWPPPHGPQLDWSRL
jgi:hypothetical protein